MAQSSRTPLLGAIASIATDSFGGCAMHPKTWLATLFVIHAVPAVAWAQVTADLPVPPAGFDTMKDVPHGEVSDVIMYPADGGMRRTRVYTPPGYSEAQQYPALYLLHGIGGSEDEWYDQGAPHHILDNLLAENKIKPMVLVLPRAGESGQFQTFAAFESILVNDLVGYIEANYSVIPTREARALAGLSMGGGQTLDFGFGNMDVFASLGAFSPAPNAPSVTSAIPDVAAVKQQMKSIFISCGTGPGEADPGVGYLTRCQSYANFMDDNDIEHVYQEEPNLNHEFVNWKRGLYNFTQRIFDDTTSPGGSGGMGGGGTGGTAGSGGGANGGTGGSSAGSPANGGANAAGGTAGGAGGTSMTAGSSSGGASGSGAIASGGTQAGTATNPANGGPPDGGAGCGCRVGAQRGSWASSFALAAAALGLLRARRRRAA